MALKKVAITGASGQIAYSLLFRIARGELFGPNVPVALHLLELPQVLPSLEGVVMELEDSAFPLLKEVKIGSDPHEVFQDIDWALLVGAKPRGQGMERKDLLLDNGHIFVEQGKAINSSAKKDVKVLAVGNPCNTNAWIARSQAKRVNPDNFFAMTRLDQNRATASLAKKANVKVDDVTHVAIWGNHSSTQVPDYHQALIQGKPAEKVIDLAWLQNEFFKQVQERGAQVIKARGKSSAASAASAIIDTVKEIENPTKEWFSLALSSSGNPYGIDPDLIFSFPCEIKGDKAALIPGLEWDAFIKEKIKATEKELQEERDAVRHLVRG